MRMTGFIKKLGFIFVTCWVASTAAAEPGDGFSAGNLTVHPGLKLTGNYDTNVFFLSSEETEILSAPSMKVTPYLDLSTTNPDVFNFGLRGSVGWQQYLSPSIATLQGQSGLDASADLGLGINESGTLSLRLEDAFKRTNEPPYTPSALSFDRTTNRAGITLGFHPGGKVFQHYLSYDWTLSLNDQIPDVNRQLHDFTFRNYWRFLPKTALVLAGDLGLVRYSKAQRFHAGQNYENINSMPIRISGGLTGLITNRLSLKLIGGWGFGLYEKGTNFSGVLADLQVKYAIGSIDEKSSIFLGYERQFSDATIANFSSWHKPYVGYEQSLGNRRLTLKLRGEMMLRAYTDVFLGIHNVAGGQVNIPGSVSDSILKIKGGVNFKLTKWFSTSVDYSLTSNFTEDRLDASGSAKDSLREFTRHFVGLGLNVKY